MYYLLAACLVAGVLLFVRTSQRGGGHEDVTVPLTTDDLSSVPERARPALLEADVLTRQYLRVLGSGSITQAIRPQSDLPASVTALKNSLLLVASFRASRSKDPQAVVARLREAYMALAFFPPTMEDAVAAWERSDRGRAAALEAGKMLQAGAPTLKAAMQEAARLAKEFVDEMVSIVSGAAT